MGWDFRYECVGGKGIAILRTPDDDERLFPRAPITGVGAIVCKDGKVLLVKRGKEPNRGKWTVPGGVVELGESLHEALKREVREECSIDIEVEKVLDTFDAITRDDDGRVRYHFIIIDFLAKYAGGEIEAGSDAEECRWVSPEELAGIDVTPSLLKVLGRAGIV
jgi:8-oxo-dGTP diphosphatase